MNLTGYDEPWFEYAHDGEKEKLGELGGLYLNNEVAPPPYKEALKCALNAAVAAESTSIPEEVLHHETNKFPTTNKSCTDSDLCLFEVEDLEDKNKSMPEL